MNDSPSALNALSRLGPLNVQAPERTHDTVVVQVITVVRRRYKLIIAVLIAALIAGLIITLLMTPRYTASTALEIRRETETFVNVQGAEAKQTFPDEEFYETQYGLLRAQSLAERVATELHLYDKPAFFAELKAAAGAKLPPSGDVMDLPRGDRVRLAGEALLRSVSVAPERFSRLVTIRYTDPDPIRAQQVVNHWSAAFIQMALERRFNATRYARDFLEGRLKQLRQRIDDSQRQLVSYAARENIVNLPTGTAAGPGVATGNTERSIVADNLSALNDELNKASAARIEAETRLGGRPSEVSEALQNTAISTLRQRRAEAAADYAKMRVQFESEYPPVKAIQRQIEQLDISIAREESRVAGALDQNYRAARDRENSLKKRVGALENGLLDYRRRSIDYQILQREVDTNQQLYDALLQRYKEIGVAGGVGINNVSIIDDAEVPRRPSSPNLIVNILIALVAGSIISAGLVIALEQLDQNINDPDDVQRIFDLPTLGAVTRTSASEDVIELVNDRKSRLSEAYRSIQTSLGFATEHGLPKSVGVTSSRPAEGKSTTSYALARSFARSAGRILLIDGDMRSPSLHHIFGVDNHRGLSNHLAGDNDLASMIMETDHPSLSFMPAGATPPSASELLSTGRFEDMLSRLLTTYDHVLVDLPPVMGLADSPLVSNILEGIVFVIEAHSTKRSIAQVAINRLNTTRGRIFGVVLTKFSASQAHGSGYDAAYGYGYGYGETTDKRV